MTTQQTERTDWTGQIWFTTRQAGAYATYSPTTILRACESGELKGHQRRPGARWRIHREELDRWLRGEAVTA